MIRGSAVFLLVLMALSVFSSCYVFKQGVFVLSYAFQARDIDKLLENKNILTETANFLFPG